MKSKTIAMALGILMVLSCFTAVSFASDDSDAVTGPEAGSAWGLGASFDRSDIIDIANSAITEMGLDEYIKLLTGDEKITEENYLRIINQLLTFASSDVDVKITDLNMNGDAWIIYEIVEKNSNGYVVDYATVFGTDITFAGTFKEKALDNDTDELIIEKMKAGVYFYEKGSVYLDRDFAVTALDSSYRLSMQVDLSANIDIVDGEMELVDRVVDRSYYLNLDGGLDAILIDGVMHLLPTGDETKWKDTFDVRIDMNAGFNTNLPLTDEEEIGREVRETEYIEDVEINMMAENVDGVLYIYPLYDIIDDAIENAIDEIGEILKEEGIMIPIPPIDKDEIIGSMCYTYPFEANPNIPGEILIDGSLKLSDSSKKEVWKGVDRVVDEAGDVTEGLEFTVTFKDIDGKVLKKTTVGYGDTVELPTVYDGKIITDDDGEKEAFVGWETDDDIIWKSTYPVKRNLVLEPDFADVVSDDRTPVQSDFDRNGTAVWELNQGSSMIDKAIDNSLLQGENTLYVTVTDDDGKVLYKWKLSAGNSGAGTATIIPEIKEQSTPDKDYLKAVSDGKNALYLDFSASGKMPGDTTISYYVGDRFADGSTVTIYYDNATTGCADFSGTSVVKNGYIDIGLAHCSSYLVVGDDAGSSDSGSGMDTTTIVIIVVVVIVVILIAAYFLMRSRKDKSE